MSAVLKELRFAVAVAADANDEHAVAVAGDEDVGDEDAAVVVADDDALVGGEIVLGDGHFVWLAVVVVPIAVVAVAVAAVADDGLCGEGVFAGAAGEDCDGYVEDAEHERDSGRENWAVGGLEHCDTELVMHQMCHMALGTNRNP